MTTVNATLKTDPLPEMKRFEEFALGDVVLSCEGESSEPNGAIGIKVGAHSIRWVRSSLGTSSALTHTTLVHDRYAVPSHVNIEVSL